jgi:hypothetical protein
MNAVDKKVILRYLRSVSVLLAMLALFSGCTTTAKAPTSSAHALSLDLRPTDKPPFFTFVDDMVQWGPSSSFKQAQKSFKALCVNDDLLNRDSASAAVDLLDRALTQPDIKPQERQALEKQHALAQESFRFFELVAHTWDRFGPGIQSADPYVNETALKDYIAVIDKAAPSFSRPGYQSALHKQSVVQEQQYNDIARRIRDLEREYFSNLTNAQYQFVQQSARNDVDYARNQYRAGKSWFWDNNDIIAQGLRPVYRVQTTPQVHTSIRSDADRIDRMIRSELWSRKIDDELRKPELPRYTDETNYPGNSDSAKRQWVRSQWNRKSSESLEIKTR